ncbi:MAG: tRNA (adenosine(37)-N6)-dimethylallyltransferase MiaA [Kiritimatiellia bacterium]
MRGRRAFVVVGPTASGKSTVGQYLAERMHGAILSADSMLVYSGMDIGTAKPAISERGRVPYLGLDLVRPDEDFDVWQYVQLVRAQVAALPPEMPLLVVGGSGLYVKALIEGLDTAAPPLDRERWELIFAERGVDGLQEVLRALNPVALERLADPLNPRRLIRAIEQAAQVRGAKESPQTWRRGGQGDIPFAGLMPEGMQLRQRIAQRVEKMYQDGLLAEAQRLRQDYPTLSSTACQAIGYREAFAVLDGELDDKQAQERTIIRTNRLAKRQRTWFRHQAHVEWVTPDADFDVAQIASEIDQIWRKHGPVQIREQ